jgi:glutathione S-transferase
LHPAGLATLGWASSYNCCLADPGEWLEVNMALQLVGHYDSPYVRRVAVSLHALGVAFERRPLSVFRHEADLQAYNPIGRVPAPALDDGEVLIESAAILDHLDEEAGPDRALLPPRGKVRREALQLMALATGANDKAMAIAYERRRPAAKIDEAWIARCVGQLERALAAIEPRLALRPRTR